MIKQFLLLLTGLMMAFTVEAKKVQGKIFFEDDTIDVMFNIPVSFLSSKVGYEEIQMGIKYYNSEGKKVKLKPAEAKEVRFNYKNEEVRLLSRLNSIEGPGLFNNNRYIFLKLEIDGEVKLFKYFFTRNNASYSPSPGMVMSVSGGFPAERYILQKRDGELKRLKSLGFRNDMIDYFIDCPTLTRKIEEREFRKAELESIVRFYNEACKEDSIIENSDF